MFFGTSVVLLELGALAGAHQEQDILEGEEQ